MISISEETESQSGQVIFPKAQRWRLTKLERSPHMQVPKSKLHEKPPCCPSPLMAPCRAHLSLRQKKGPALGPWLGQEAPEVPSTSEIVEHLQLSIASGEGSEKTRFGHPSDSGMMGVPDQDISMIPFRKKSPPLPPGEVTH